MNVDFYSAHLDTLCELKELAEKHNCTISFGVRNESERGITSIEGFKDYFYEEIPEQVLSDLKLMGYFDESESFWDNTTLWFELYDRSTNKHNVMTYSDGYLHLKFQEFMSSDLSDETEDWLADYEPDWAQDLYDDYHIIYRRYCPVTVRGFNGAKEPNVYREGMALKFFGDLVCDYLGEKRIERTY